MIENIIHGAIAILIIAYGVVVNISIENHASWLSERRRLHLHPFS